MAVEVGDPLRVALTKAGPGFEVTSASITACASFWDATSLDRARRPRRSGAGSPLKSYLLANLVVYVGDGDDHLQRAEGFLGDGGLHRHTVHVVDICVRAELVVERRIEGQHSGDANGEASGASQ